MNIAPPAVRAVLPFAVVGTVAIVVGGLVAAVTGPAGWGDHGSWAAAYLVLVTGVAQIGLGIGHVALASHLPSTTRRAVQLAGWNGGSLLVIGGTLASSPAIVAVGAVALVIALVAFVVPVRGGTGPAWVRPAFAALVALLVVSIPVGVVLSVVRA